MDELDVRLYAADGTRKVLDPGRVASLQWEVLDRGGMGMGTLVLTAEWDEVSVSIGDRVDVWLYDTRAYRGWVQAIERVVAEQERCLLRLVGLMGTLAGYMVRRQYAYADAADAETVFDDLVADHVTTAGRLPSAVVSSATIGVTMLQFDARDVSVCDALDQLCDATGNLAYWGCDIDGSGDDRVYLRLRPTVADQFAAIGRHVLELAHPSDAGSVVNRIFLRGGPVAQANMITNGSFEEIGPASEVIGNILPDHSLEASGAGGTVWTTNSDANLHTVGDPGFGEPHSGNAWARLGWDLGAGSPGGLETNFPGVPIDPTVIYRASAWVRRYDTSIAGADFKIALYLRDGGFGNLGFVWSAEFTAPTEWTRFTCDLDLSGEPTAAWAEFEVWTEDDNPDPRGIIVDDLALYPKGALGQRGWIYTLAGDARVDELVWGYDGIAAFHGGYSVRMMPRSIAAGTDYMELRTYKDDRVKLIPGMRYGVSMRYQTNNEGAVDAEIGVEEFASDGTSKGAQTLITLSAVDTGTWTLATGAFIAQDGAASAELFVRVTSNAALMVDAVMMCQGDAPDDVIDNDCYWVGDTFEATIDVEDAGLSLSAEAADSITDYGEQEAVIDQTSVTDHATLLAFANGWFDAHAVPRIEGAVRIPVLSDTELWDTDGLVRVVGLSSPVVAALRPNRLQFSVSDAEVVCEAQIGNERPTLEGLIRELELRR